MFGAFLTTSLLRLRPLRGTAGNIFPRFIPIINPVFRFIRKTLLGHEEEGTDTSKILKNLPNNQNGQNSGTDIGDHRHQRINGSDDTLPAISQKFFSQLERKEVEGLIQKYQIDLEMWGYSPQPYLELST